MSKNLDVPFDRITYRDGQLLTARDLTDDQHRHARLRALHNRHLHETWGIALGFRVYTLPGSKVLIIGPGHAVDEAGRDILLTSFTPVPVPDVSGPEMFALSVSYREDDAFSARRDLTSLCLGDAAARERPNFSWQRPLEARFGLQVPLVAVTVAQGKIEGELNLRVRRNARPHIHPRIGWETTEAGRTGWQMWAPGEEASLGLEVVVNTAGAGFSQAPHYFAILLGDFSNQPGKPPLFQFPAWTAGAGHSFGLDSFGFITDATAESFTYRITCTGQPPFVRTLMPSEAESRHWHLSWLGVEPVPEDEPAPDLSQM